MSRKRKPKIISSTGMPVDAWPEVDRAAWQRAFVQRSLLDSARGGTRLAENTRRRLATAYGRWLRWLTDHYPELLALAPAERITHPLMATFAQFLLLSVAASSTAEYLRGVGGAVRLLAPEAELPWLNEMALKAAASGPRPQRKRDQLVPPRDSFAFGLELMEAARSDHSLTDVERAIDFRDGLLIAFLATRPLRRENLMGLTLDVQLFRSEQGYVVEIPAEMTKTNRALEFPLPRTLTPCMDDYLERFRAVLQDQAAELGDDEEEATQPVWLSVTGRPMNSDMLYKMVVRRMRDRFNKHQPPHRFRNAAATWIAIEMPEDVFIIREILGQALQRTSERHYQHGGMMEAGRKWATFVERKERES